MSLVPRWRWSRRAQRVVAPDPAGDSVSAPGQPQWSGLGVARISIGQTLVPFIRLDQESIPTVPFDNISPSLQLPAGRP